jgi:hypothetical protein
MPLKIKRTYINNNNMNRYNCLLILPEGTKDVTILADTVHPDSTCATRFQKKIEVIGLYGSPEPAFQIVGQYPTDRFVIESVDYNIETP